MSTGPPKTAPATSPPPPVRRGGAVAQDSQILAQRSPAASVRSQIQLRPTTVVHINEAEEDDGRSTTVRGGAELHEAAAADSLTDRTRAAGEVDEEEEEEEEEEQYDDQQPLTRINVGHAAWDDSDEDDGDEIYGRGEAGFSARYAASSRPDAARRQSGRTGAPHHDDHSYRNSLRPTATILRRWLVRLTKSPSAHASLSAPHVTANLFSASLNPAVLLSMPAYFDRTGIALGIVGMVVVAALAGAGGGLWVVLGRYVGGANIEAITAASFGRNTRWKGNLGRGFSGLLLACYGTGTAVIAYFALADLLLQVLFHYAPRGIPLHNRLFVTFVVGGLISTPLVIYPLAKRNLIRLSTTLAVLFYPCTLAILLAYIYKQPVTQNPRHPASAPQLNPLYPPSIWAPFSLLPLFSLSASPLQIIAHNRSLRRTGISGSNVKAFLAAQAAQTLAAIGIAIAFGVGVGTQGMGRRLGVDIHPNLFTTLPLTDNLNLARVLFIAILVSHLALCLVTVRSAWARLLFLFNLNPFRTGRRTEHSSGGEDDVATAATTSAAADTTHDGGGGGGQSFSPIAGARIASYGTVGAMTHGARQKTKKKSWIGKRWTRPARDALAGVLLWAMTAVVAYWSGVGGIHLRKGQKNDPDDIAVQANFTRAEEVLGLLGAGVNFVLPALVWIILFHIRQPRAILPPFAAEMARQASAWFLGPQSVLAARRWRGAGRRTNAVDAAERQPLLDEHAEDREGGTDASPSLRAYRQSLVAQAQTSEDVPSWRTETQMAPASASAAPQHSANESDMSAARASFHQQHQNGGGIQEADEATRILLARKEREMQRRTRGRRVYQDIIVLAGILPLGVSLIVLGALDLRHGGW